LYLSRSPISPTGSAVRCEKLQKYFLATYLNGMIDLNLFAVTATKMSRHAYLLTSKSQKSKFI
jgi:hypothetical protein